MLNKVKNLWQRFKFAIAATAIALAYLIGKRKGKDHEKTRQDKAFLADVARGNSARRRLNDPAVTDRLHKKYERK